MDTVVEKSERPSSITLVSVFAFLSALLSFYFIFRDGIQELGLGNIVFFALGGTVLLVCSVGFWRMKKWAVYTYLVFGILDQIVLLLIGRWTILALLVPVLFIYIGFRNLSRMS